MTQAQASRRAALDLALLTVSVQLSFAPWCKGIKPLELVALDQFLPMKMQFSNDQPCSQGSPNLLP